jgi:hypothetical protein
MKRTATTAAITLFLTACAAPGSNGHWLHQTHQDPAQFERDRAQCIYESNLATASAPAYGRLSAQISQDIATGMRQGELQRMCMESRQYYWVSQ